MIIDVIKQVDNEHRILYYLLYESRLCIDTRTYDSFFEFHMVQILIGSRKREAYLFSLSWNKLDEGTTFELGYVTLE